MTVDKPELLGGKRVLVVEDGPTTTHGGVPGGAGLRVANQVGATPVDPRPWAAGSIGEVYRRFPHIGPVLPAMGYSESQRLDLQATIAATPCDAVLVATPIDLRRVVSIKKPVVRATYRAAFEQPDALAALLTRFNPTSA